MLLARSAWLRSRGARRCHRPRNALRPAAARQRLTCEAERAITVVVFTARRVYTADRIKPDGLDQPAARRPARRHAHGSAGDEAHSQRKSRTCSGSDRQRHTRDHRLQQPLRARRGKVLRQEHRARWTGPIACSTFLPALGWFRAMMARPSRLRRPGQSRAVINPPPRRVEKQAAIQSWKRATRVRCGRRPPCTSRARLAGPRRRFAPEAWHGPCAN
jgi:hypothetical protein